MLQQTAGFVKGQMQQVKRDIGEMEELIQLLQDAGEPTAELRRQLVETRQRMDKWANALKIRGIELEEE